MKPERNLRNSTSCCIMCYLLVFMGLGFKVAQSQLYISNMKDVPKIKKITRRRMKRSRLSSSSTRFVTPRTRTKQNPITINGHQHPTVALLWSPIKSNLRSILVVWIMERIANTQVGTNQTIQTLWCVHWYPDSVPVGTAVCSDGNWRPGWFCLNDVSSWIPRSTSPSTPT